MVTPFSCTNRGRYWMLNVFHSVVLGIYAHSGESSYKFCLLGFETAFTTVVNKNAVDTTPIPIALEIGQRNFDSLYNLFIFCRDVFLVPSSTAAQIVSACFSPLGAQALALPLLTKAARAMPLARCTLSTWMWAAFTALVV